MIQIGPYCLVIKDLNIIVVKLKCSYKKVEGEDNIKSKKLIERTIKVNLKWLRLLTAVFLSTIMLLGCNNVEEDNDPPPPEVDVDPDREEPIEDPEDANDPDNIDENKDDEADLVPDAEEPIEDPKDVNDPDNIDE
ncbi:hypothetical protein M3638_18660 [Oceanobacillus profundus]|uniref:hypothetical protein n=1 Tax=Oceanobacillus profundus TaxID=372463 RepID=UPI00203EE143|nr:hypothetical protein [Oceanobacillus profundus]MCM3399839.1 hypothetical protein [Oceanobacillus profundus]